MSSLLFRRLREDHGVAYDVGVHHPARAMASPFVLHASTAIDKAMTTLSELPLAVVQSQSLWEVKVLTLLTIFVYAFFKFAWAYRLFNYVAILFGAMPPAGQRDTPEAEAHVIRTTRLFETAGRHFNRGQRAFFFALGYLGWFVSPWVLFATTAAVVIVIWRRQFASNAWQAMGS